MNINTCNHFLQKPPNNQHIYCTFLEEQRVSDNKAKADSILMKTDAQD